jgi:hypothetical protein
MKKKYKKILKKFWIGLSILVVLGGIAQLIDPSLYNHAWWKIIFGSWALFDSLW